MLASGDAVLVSGAGADASPLPAGAVVSVINQVVFVKNEFK